MGKVNVISALMNDLQGKKDEIELGIYLLKKMIPVDRLKKYMWKSRLQRYWKKILKNTFMIGQEYFSL